jgi:hypothetical protein
MNEFQLSGWKPRTFSPGSGLFRTRVNCGSHATRALAPATRNYSANGFASADNGISRVKPLANQCLVCLLRRRGLSLKPSNFRSRAITGVPGTRRFWFCAWWGGGHPITAISRLHFTLPADRGTGSICGRSAWRPLRGTWCRNPAGNRRAARLGVCSSNSRDSDAAPL